MVVTITLNPAVDRTLHIHNPLEPNKLNRATGSFVEPGGKGISISRAIKAMGGTSIATGFTAGSNGRYMKDTLTAIDLQHDFVDVPGQTRVNIQIIGPNGEHTEINEPGYKVSDGDYLRFLERLAVYLHSENIFVLSGASPVDFSLKNYGKICKKIKAVGATLIVDAYGDRLREALKYKPDLIKPNPYELAELVGEQATLDPEELAVQARKVLDMGAKAVCVSIGRKGAVLVTEDDRRGLYANTKVEITEDGAVGTGDAMVAAFANGMRQNIEFPEMLKFSVAAGRACAKLPGIQTASLKQVYEVYEMVQLYIMDPIV